MKARQLLIPMRNPPVSGFRVRHRMTNRFNILIINCKLFFGACSSYCKSKRE